MITLPQISIQTLNLVLFSLVILVLAKIIDFFVQKFLFNKFYSLGVNRLKGKKKLHTLFFLIKHTTQITIYAFALLIILDKIGVNILPFLTGAGIVGLALSFGSQTLVKDIISGIFIIVENQFNVEDEVKIGSFEGKVKKITLKTTYLEDKDGNKIIIPNSQINSVLIYKSKKK